MAPVRVQSLQLGKEVKLDDEETMSRNVFGDSLAIDFAGDGVVLLPLVSGALSADIIDLHALFGSVRLDEFAPVVVFSEFKSTVSVNLSLLLSKRAALHKVDIFVDALVRVVVLVMALASLLLSLWMRPVIKGPVLADSVKHAGVMAILWIPRMEHHLSGGTCEDKS